MTAAATPSTFGGLIRTFGTLVTHSSRRFPYRRALSTLAAGIIAATSVVGAPIARLVPPATAQAAGSFTDPHFADFTVFSGLDHPTTVRFADDGRAFVAEKGGVVKEFDFDR